MRKNILDNIKFWQPHVPHISPIKKTVNTSIKIAAIVSERLFHGFRYECNLLLLTENSWEETMMHGGPDLLLVESCIATATGDWHLPLNNLSKGPSDVIRILSLAKKNNVPSVFWITQDFQYIEHYKNIAAYFDYVFCADTRSVEALCNAGIKATVLLPAIQPAIYHPFREYDFSRSASLNVLYDGICDLEEYGEHVTLLKDVKKYGLSIIESRYKLLKGRISFFDDLNNNILGCVTFASRIVALKYASAFLMISKSLATRTTQQWMALECAACRTPVLHLGELLKDDIRKDIVAQHKNNSDILTELYRFKEDDLYREKLAHLAWRKVNSEHTFTHRFQTICQAASVPLINNSLPLISTLFASKRESHIENCIKTFKNQKYKNKEMIIIYNGPLSSSITKAKIEEKDCNIRLLVVPEETTLGLSINMGVASANGSYCFKMDDDDLYSEHYISDMMLYTKALDIDLFGKSQSRFTYYESDESYWYTKKSNRSPLCLIPYNHQKYPGKMYVSGNTIGATTQLMKKYPWDNDIPKGSDNVFLASIDTPVNIVTTDVFNMAVVRRKKSFNHTWQIDEEELKHNSIKISSRKEAPCFIV